MLEEYPKRSKNLEVGTDNPMAAKNINEKFVKDGFMYLLRGAKKGQETGFYSREIIVQFKVYVWILIKLLLLNI